MAQKTKYFSSDQLRKFFNIVEDKKVNTKNYKRDSALFWLCLQYGMRASEVVSLKIDDIDFDERRIYINRLKRRKEFIDIQPLSFVCADKVKKWLKERKRLGIESDWLFTSQKGGHIKHMSANRLFVLTREYGKKAGLGNGTHPHMFRHSAAIQMVKAGATALDVKDRLGHASATSSERYCEMFGEDRERRLRKAEQSIGRF